MQSTLARSNRTAEDEEEVDFAKQALRVREMERKATFEQTQTEVRRQKDQLQMLRRENKELRSVQAQTAKGQNTNSEQFQRKQTDLMRTKLHQLRRQLDDLKSGNDRKTGDLAAMNEKVDVVRRDTAPVLDDSTPLTQKIRLLENRLDKSLIKHNEALAIRKTYEQIVKRLREERVGFDNQLAAIEKTLKAKEHDFLELKNMEHDAHHAKEIAKAEVQQFKAAYAEERRQKKKELEERRAYVAAKMEQANRAEKAAKQKQQREEAAAAVKAEEEAQRQKNGTQQSTAALRTEEEEERLRQYAEAYRKIKEATRATTVDEVAAKFIGQEDTHRQLVELTEEAHLRIETLKAERAELQRKVDEGKYSGSGQLGSRRIVDEFEAHLAEAKQQLEKAQHEYEHNSQVFTGCKAGIEHLCDKLSGYRPENQQPAVTDESVVEALRYCEQKLQILVDEVSPTADDEVLGAVTLDTAEEIEMPQYNKRVKATDAPEDEEEDYRRNDMKDAGAEDADDDPHDRVALKEMSASAVERETKKQRKRGRRKDDDY